MFLELSKHPFFHVLNSFLCEGYQSIKGMLHMIILQTLWECYILNVERFETRNKNVNKNEHPSTMFKSKYSLNYLPRGVAMGQARQAIAWGPVF